MQSTSGSIPVIPETFKVENMSFRYSHFVPKLYNLLISLGFEKSKIMPSRAFCSDESQSYPIIMLAKHFGTFPFNHGRVGGIVATDRHGPHAHHGKDLLIVHASHVGYDPTSSSFGRYKRLQTEGEHDTASCGKICGTIEWYTHEYDFASQNIQLFIDANGKKMIKINNKLLDKDRNEGLMLKLEKFIDLNEESEAVPEVTDSLSTTYAINNTLLSYLEGFEWPDNDSASIGHFLHPELFYYRSHSHSKLERQYQLENNLLNEMPYVVTSNWPALAAAQVNTQMEFNRTLQSIKNEPAYKGKRLFFISGINIDISPQTNQIFPHSKYVPWAAYFQDANGETTIWNQAELFNLLNQQSINNPDEVDLENVIKTMRSRDEIKLLF